MNKGSVFKNLKKLISTILNFLKKINLSKEVKQVLLILFFSLSFLFIFINRDKFSPDNISISIYDTFKSFGFGPGFPYELCDKKVNNQNFKTVGKNLVLASDTNFTCLNSSAKIIENRNHSYSNPILKVNDKRVMLYDIHNKGFELGTISTNGIKKSLKDDILAGNIAANGTYAIVTKNNGCLGKLNVFKNNQESAFFEYLFSDCYISDLALNNNGKICSCIGFNSCSGEIVSSLFIFDYKESIPKFKIDFNKSMALNIQYIDDKKLVVIFDNMISIVDTIKGTKTDYFFNEKTLTSYCINDGKIILSLSLSDDGDNCEVLIFKKNGTLENTIKTDLKIKSLAYCCNKVAVLSYGVTYVYNSRGKVLKKSDCFKDAKKVEFLSSNAVYILTMSDIKKFNF